MITTTVQTLAELTQQLREDGYEAGVPERAIHAEEIDAEVAAESSCDHCGRYGLSYEPWHCGRSYRAVAYCLSCRAAIEF